MEDKIYRFMHYYENLPLPLKKAAGTMYRMIPIGLRLGKEYKKFKKLIRDTEFASRKALREYQWKQVSIVLDEAFNHIPYYKKKYAGIRRAEIRSLEDLKKLPLLTKEEVQKNYKSMISVRHRNDGLKLLTSGSTGNPTTFLLHKGISRPKELAFMEDQWKKLGYRHGDRSVILRGIAFRKASEFYTYEPIKNALILSATHMSEQNLSQYVRMIRDYSPKYIQAFPSCLMTLAAYMKKKRIPRFRSVRGLLLGSEKMYPFHRRLFEQVFQAKMYSWYGHTEKVVLGGFCEHEDTFHFYPQYGYLELIDNGKTVSKKGRTGEIVGTGFHNLVMPLIRYRTDDYATYGSTHCQSCKRNYPILSEIGGRRIEMLISKTGRKQTMTTIAGIHSSLLENVQRFQFYQDKPGAVEFRYMPNKNFSKKDYHALLKELSVRLGRDFDIKIKKVGSIKLSSTGKQGYLIQKLKVEW